MNAQEQYVYYGKKMSELFKQFQALNSHPDIYVGWGIAVSILKTQKAKLEKYGEGAYSINRNDVFRLEEIIKDAEKALETVKARAAQKAEMEQVEATAKALNVEVSIEFDSNGTIYVSAKDNGQPVRQQGGEAEDFTVWLRGIAMYAGSEDIDENDPYLQGETEDELSFEGMEEVLRQQNLMEYEGWYPIRDKDDIKWLVPPDYHWNEAAKEKRIRL